MPINRLSRDNALSAILIALLSVLALGCEPASDSGSSSGHVEPSADTISLSIYTVNYPLAYFAERIGGRHVSVTFPVPPGVDPATWSPAPEEIAAYQRADLVLLNGAGYSAWIARATLPAKSLVDTSATFRDDYLYIEDAPTHVHGPAGEHSHRDIAATTWLDPLLAIDQARAIRNALAGARPDLESEFKSGFNLLSADLADLDQGFGMLLEQEGDRPLLFSHPVYQYFSRRYQLNSRSLHWEPDQPLNDKEMEEFAEILATQISDVVIWERKPLPETIEVLERLSVSSPVFETGANRPADGDYLSLMQRNLENLTDALQP
jgi:zinc transport system substrate-binding protein